MLRRAAITRYVTPLREGGSLPAVVEADDDGTYVAKFRGAGQGPKALVAEVVAGELARGLGLLVPELAVLALDPAIGRAEPDPEIQELLQASEGANLGVDFLPGSLPFSPAAEPDVDPALAARIVWFDALVTNPDRTARNTNMLWWHGRLWLIDHGAALYFHHADRVEGHAARAFEHVGDHVLLPYASSIAAADEDLAPRVTREMLEGVVSLVPDEWLDLERAVYVDYLSARLAARDAWVTDAERRRAG